jgi:signal transduction histidine kinase/CheY-like chemotaxis protein
MEGTKRPEGTVEGSPPRAPRRSTRRAPVADSGERKTELYADLQAVLAEKQPPEAIKRALVAVERAVKARSVFAAIHDPAFDRLNVAAARGRADPRIAAASPGEGPLGAAYTDRLVKIEGDGALVAVPMLAFGRCAGVLVVLGGAWSGPLGPDEAELACVQAVANACGAAADAARARSDADRRAREMEAAAERLREGDRTRDALLSHLSHELRTPLTTIKGYLALAQKGRLGELTPKQKDAFAVCDRNADRLLRLINDLLLTARLQAGKMTLDPRPLGLRGVLDEAINFLHDDSAAAGVTVNLEVEDGEVFVRGNRDRLVEGFMHLVERGLRGRRDGQQVAVTLSTRGRVGSVEIVLGGVHVPSEELATLFDTLRASGGSSNIGLSIARQIFELHGGTLAATQGPKGLVFQVSLPLFAGAVTAVAAPAEGEVRSGEILIVEDDADCRNALIDVLQGEDYGVRAYEDGRSALERIQEVPPALVLLDLRIPGVDGAALIKAVREGGRGEKTPIYVISGAIDAQAGADVAWGERVDGIFEKPLNFPYLLERIREYVAPGASPGAKT